MACKDKTTGYLPVSQNHEALIEKYVILRPQYKDHRTNE